MGYPQPIYLYRVSGVQDRNVKREQNETNFCPYCMAVTIFFNFFFFVWPQLRKLLVWDCTAVTQKTLGVGGWEKTTTAI